MRIGDFIEQTNRAPTPGEAFSVLVRAATDLGVDRVVYADVSGFPETQIDPQSFVVNYPESWTQYYFEHKLDQIDPVTKYAFVAPRPFLWEDLPSLTHLSDAEKQCMDQCEEAGLYSGACVPIRGPYGELADVGFASSARDAEVRPHLDLLLIMATQFKNCYSRLFEPTTPPGQRYHLTAREREVLSWCFRGKSSWSIGEILGISEDSVNFHIKNAMRKLDCSSRLMCVLKAIRLGLILP